MQLLGSVTRFFQWRWAPCVGLVLGALAFITLAVAFIPEQLGAIAEGEDGGDALETVGTEKEQTASEAAMPARKRAQRKLSAATPGPTPTPDSTVQGFFSAPTVELPPPLEEPPPPPPPPPAPTPTEMTVTVPPPEAPPAEPVEPPATP